MVQPNWSWPKSLRSSSPFSALPSAGLQVLSKRSLVSFHLHSPLTFSPEVGCNLNAENGWHIACHIPGRAAAIPAANRRHAAEADHAATVRIPQAPARIPRDDSRAPVPGDRGLRRLGPAVPRRLRPRGLSLEALPAVPGGPLQAALPALRQRPRARAGRALLVGRDGGRAEGRRLSRDPRGSADH